MSASSKKKLRKENEAELLSNKQAQERSEQKKLKRQTIGFVTLLVVIVAVFAFLFVKDWVNSSGIVNKLTSGATVGDEKLNSVELSYYYTDAVQDIINEWYSTASEYASYAEMTEEECIKMLYNIDLSLPLSTQIDESTGETWSDYFMGIAMENAQYDYALSNAAKKAGYALPEDYQTTLSGEKSTLEFWGSYYGSTKSYLVSIYGSGAEEDSYLEYRERALLAEAYYAHVSEQYAAKTYTEEELRAYETGKELDYNTYDYSYYYLSYATFQTTSTDEIEETVEETVGDDSTEEIVIEEAEEETEAEATGTEETVTGETVAEETVSEETVTEETPAEETVAEETVAEETVAEETVAEETVTEETAVEETVEETEESADETEDEAVTEETETIDDDTARAMAKEAAESLATCTTVEELDAAIAALPINASNSSAASIKKTNTLYASITSVMQEWVTDSARVEGDITVLANEATDGTVNGYYVVFYQGMSDNTAPMSNVRHLLVGFETDGEDSDPTEEQIAAAWTEAESLKATWEAGEKTEESFTALIAEHSDDTADGLYEDINPSSSYVEAFLNWSIDPSRQVGDCEIVETEYGCHIMYFTGYSEMSYRDQMIAEDIQAGELDAWYAECLAGYPTTVKNTSKIDLDAGLV